VLLGRKNIREKVQMKVGEFNKCLVLMGRRQAKNNIADKAEQ